jgi:hypothetical protein
VLLTTDHERDQEQRDDEHQGGCLERGVRTGQEQLVRPGDPVQARRQDRGPGGVTRDCHQTGQAQGGPDLLGDVDQTGSRAGLVRSDVVQGRAGQRHERQAVADTEEHQSDHHVGVPARVVQPGQPDQREQADHRAGDHHDAVAELLDQDTRAGLGGQEHAGSHRQEGQTGLDRGEAEDVLQVLGEEEERTHGTRDQEHPGQQRTAAGPAREQTQRGDRFLGTPLDRDERDQQRDAAHH